MQDKSTDQSIDTAQKVNDTLNLINQANKVIENSIHQDLVLVLGNSGVGKTPFTKWMTEDNTKLISVRSAPGKPYLMQDDNNKIGNSTTKSATVFPDLFVNQTINQAYYDFPGFKDTRGMSYGIATMYSMQGIISKAKSVKMVFLVDYDSVKTAGSRDGFTGLIKSATNFIKDIGKFNSSIALVVSKVPKYINDEPLSNDQVIQIVANFIEQDVKPNLEKKDNAYYTQAIKFIDTILSQDGNDYPKIGLFRYPDQEGPFSNIPLVHQGKERIEKIIYEKLSFTEIAKDDFVCTVDDSYQNDISNVVQKIKDILISNVEKIGEKIKQHFLHIEETVADIGQLYNKTQAGYYELLETQKKAINLTSSKECIELVTKSSATINNNIINNTLLDTTTHYTNFLAFLGSNKISLQAINSFKCTTGLDKVVEYLEDAKKWYGFLTELNARLLGCYTHQNLQNYDIANLVVEQDKNKKVSEINLKHVLKKLSYSSSSLDLQYNNIKDLILDELKFKHLKTVQNSASQYNLEHPSCAPSNVIITNNSSIADLYDTLGFVNELNMYESLFYNLHENISFLPFYESLLGRVNKYKENPKGDEKSEDYKTVLSYLRTSILSKISYIKNNQKDLLVINVKEYFSLVAKHTNDYINTLKEVKINTHREQYRTIINTQITNANNLIEKEILPEIDNIIKETDTQIRTLVNEIISLKEAGEKERQNLIDKQQKLEAQLPLRAFLGVLQIGSQALAFAGPYGAAAGAVINTVGSGVYTHLDETSSTGTDKITALPTGISKSWAKVTDLLKGKQKIFEKKLYDVEQELEKFLNDKSSKIEETEKRISKYTKELKQEEDKGAKFDPASVDKKNTLQKNITSSQSELGMLKKQKNSEIKEIKEKISKSLNDLKHEEDKGAKFDPASVDRKNTLQKEIIELIGNKTEVLKKQKYDKDIEIEKRLRIINHIQNVISMGDSIYDVYSRVQNYNAKIDDLGRKIQITNEKIKELESAEKDVYNIIIPMIHSMQDNATAAGKDSHGKSHAGLDISKWKIQSSIKDVQVKIQKMTKGLDIQPNLVHCIEKFEYGMSTMIQIYDRIQDEYDKQQLADLITNVVLRAKITSNQILGNAIDNLELTIKSNLILQEYEQAISALWQYAFPHAHKYFDEFELKNTHNSTSNLINDVVTQINNLNEKVYKDQILIMKEDQNTYSEAVFNSAKQGPGSFFVWKHEIYPKEISKLLQGKEIVIRADILQGIKHYAIKFNEIGIYFKSLNAALQGDLDNKLSSFQVNMTHLGNSYYKCGNQFYIIGHEPLQIKHYVTLEDGKYSNPNDVYAKIRNNTPIFSPYTMWSIQLFSNHDDNNIFDKFTKYTNESIDLELVGKGRYLEKNTPIYSNNLEKYYKVADDILQLDSNHKHRHHHGENHYRGRRDIDDANNIRHDSDDVMIKNYMGSTVKQISYGTVDHISTENTSSSASSITSPINTVIYWLSNGIAQLKFLSPANLVNYEYVKGGIQSIFGASKQINNDITQGYSSNTTNIAKCNVNESLTLADFLIRCVTKVKPYNTKEESIDLLYVRAYVSNVIVKYQEMLNDLSIQNNLPAEDLEFDPLDLMSRLEKEIINGDPRKLGKILYQHTINNNTDYDSSEIEEKINKILEHKNEQFTYNQELNTDNTNNSSNILEDTTNTIIGIAADINHTNYQSEVNMIG